MFFKIATLVTLIIVCATCIAYFVLLVILPVVWPGFILPTEEQKVEKEEKADENREP